MLELGEKSAVMHEELGGQAARIADVLIGVGSFSADLCRGAKAAGMKSEQLIEVPDAATAIKYLHEKQRPGDKILVKGSRGVHLEQLVDVLKVAVDTPLNKAKGN
jgi:UDP-N-acetylmuramoyl-tripeptide--D-alanyl-D-alanine ligase